jgi:uncharacterized RDD family membrane protein YckC
MTESGTPSDPATPPPASGWQAPPTAPAAPAAAVAGAPGFVYADIPNRVIALIIDSIILGVINIVIFGVINGIIGLGIISFLASLVVGLAISAGYFTYTWTAMRGTIGMRALGMQIGNASDGQTLKQDQAVRRWLILFGPQVLSAALQYSLNWTLGLVVSIAVLAWYIFLLKTTADSPTKQGYHDIFANSQVVKAARSA